MNRNVYPGNHGQEPTEAQKTLMNSLVEQSLEGAEFTPSWSLFYQDDNLNLMISRGSQCIYSEDGIRKREIEQATPIFALDLVRHLTDETEITADLRQLDSKKPGSKINIKVTDDGVLNAYLGTTNPLADFFGFASEEARAEATGNESMVDVGTGKAVADFAEYVRSITWPDVSVLQGRTLLELLNGVRQKLEDEGAGERFPVEEALEVASTLLTTCSANGELFSSVESIYVTKEHRICIEKDPFDTSYLGKNVSTYISVGTKEPEAGDDCLVSPVLYIMNDGRVIYASAFLPHGPDSDYSQMTPETYDYDKVMTTDIRPATFEDFTLFLAAMQEPREES